MLPIFQDFSLFTVGEDWVLPFLALGVSTIVTLTPSSADPSSEETRAPTELLCLLPCQQNPQRLLITSNVEHTCTYDWE